MKVTNYGPDGMPIALGGWSTGVMSINSNATTTDGGLSAINFVQRITSNASNILLNPSVNFAAGSNIALSAASNTITITGTGGSGTATFPGTVVSHGAMGATESIDYSTGTYHYGTLDANCTISFTGFTNGKDCGLTVELLEDGTGGWTPTFSGVTWLGGTTPTHTTTAGTTTIYAFFSRDGGTTIIGGQLGGGTTSPLTTKGDLYTYSTTNARLAVGSNGTGLYADSAETTGNRWTIQPIAGELLISDTPSTPLVFADVLQTDTQDDLIYADL